MADNYTDPMELEVISANDLKLDASMTKTNLELGDTLQLDMLLRAPITPIPGDDETEDSEDYGDDGGE